MFDKKETVVFTIDGMSCSHCSARVEKAITALEGVKKAVVSLEKSQAQVEFITKKTDAEIILAAINSAGYKAGIVQ